MKNIVLLLLCTWYISHSFAQKDQGGVKKTPIATCKVYFKSGSYSLDKASQESLEILLANYNAEKQFEFQLQAFTDDRGNIAQNERVAQQRADAVQKYLEEKAVLTNTIVRQPFETLTLDETGNVAAQRRENRSVVIVLFELNKITNTKLNDFFIKNRQDAQQIFSFEASEGAWLKGAQGTLLQVPSNAFVDENNDVVEGTITFTLQEVYSYSDMLLQNLSTTAGDRLLETGGMLYLEARDAANNRLELKEGVQIQAVMANSNAQLPGMQTFEGIQGTNVTVDWEATGQAIITAGLATKEVDTTKIEVDTVNARTAQILRDNCWLYQVPLNPSIRLYTTEDILLEKTMRRYFVGQRVKRPIFYRKAPKKPKVRAIAKLKRDTLKKLYQQRPNEGIKRYRKRITNLYKKAQKKYRKDRKYDRAYAKKYKKNLNAYEKALTAFNVKNDNYISYNDYTRLMMQDLYELMSTGVVKFETMHNHCRAMNHLFRGAEIQNEHLKRVASAMLSTSDYYISQGYDFKAISKELKSINGVPVPPIYYKNYYRFYEYITSDKNYRHTRSFFNDKVNKASYKKHLARVKALYDKTPKEGLLSPYQLAQIRRCVRQMERTYGFNLFVIYESQIEQVFNTQQALLKQYKEDEERILALQKRFLKAEKALGLPKTYIVGTMPNANQLAILSLSTIISREITPARDYNQEELAIQIDSLMNSNTWVTTLPDSILLIKVSKRKKRPRKPQLKKTVSLTKNVLKRKFEQHKNESDQAYEKRMDRKYAVANKKQEKITRLNLRKQQEYCADSLAYAQWSVHKKSQRAYQKNIQAVLAELNTKATTIIEKSDEARLDKLFSYFKTVVSDYSFMKKELGILENAAVEVVDSLPQIDTFIRAVKKVNSVHLSKEALNTIRRTFIVQKTSALTQTKQTCSAAQKLYQKLYRKQRITSGELNQLRQIKTRLEGDKYLSSYTTCIQTLGEHYTANKELINQFIKQYKDVINLRDLLMDAKEAAGLLTPSELATRYGNAMGINRLGWVNCDRWRDEPMMNLKILAQPTDNMSFKIVFDDTQSVINAEMLSDRWNVSVPRGRKISLVGFKVQDKKMRVCVMRDIGHRSAISPVFETKSIQEIRTLLADL